MKITTTRRSTLAAVGLAATLAVAPALAGTAAAQAPSRPSAAAKAGTVERWAGADRYEASANVSKAAFLPGVATAYIASGLVYTDALSVAPVAARDKGPVLLVRPDGVPDAVVAELTRLQPQRIVVIGGTTTITGAVINALRPLTTGEGTRIAGPSRYSTSAKISALNFATSPEVAYIASGEVFPDALSGAPVAGMTPGPTLLVEHDNVPGVIKLELERLRPKYIIVLGGESTIDLATYSFLTRYTLGAVARWASVDRFATSAVISENSFSPGVPVAYVASGRVFADALSGAPVAGMTKGPMLLVDTNAIPASIAAELVRLQPKRIVVLGGTASVTESVETALAGYIVP